MTEKQKRRVRKRVPMSEIRERVKNSQPKPKTKPKLEIKLKKPQLRILSALKDGHEMTRAEIALSAKVDNASLTGYIGSLDPVIREKNDTSWYPSLISMGLVNTMVYDERGKDVTRYFITKQGKEIANNG